MTISTRHLPEPTVPPTSDVRFEAESRGDLVAAQGDVVAVAVEDVALKRELEDKLRQANVRVAGSDAVATAAIVLIHAHDDPYEAVAEARRRARSDAAILVVVSASTAASSAYAAGAFACIHPPITLGELHGLVSSALDSHAAKAQAADLARKLLLEGQLASVGRMSAGLAHELANPLAIALLNLDVISQELSSRGRQDPNVAAAVADLAASLGRMEGLLKGLRPFVVEGTRLQSVDLAQIVRQVVQWAADSLSYVDVEQFVEPLVALADPTMLAQLLLNLTSNAAHAAKSLPSPRVRFHVYSAGGGVVVSVRDNGPGIPEELHDRIFEPFFTTRRGRGGTGLGLALCREYARRMGGTLSLWSAPGRGACFRLTLNRA
jgi:C4-dicarboxylate-specific signal transduction histidine kinase